MINILSRLFFLMALVSMVPVLASAHPGNTASDGCHYCRTRCDYWGVAWNQRHCHNSRYVAPAYTFKPTPRPTLAATPRPEDTISARIRSSQNSYNKNPHGFRERLIKELVNEFGQRYAHTIDGQVYRILIDVGS